MGWIYDITLLGDFVEGSLPGFNALWPGRKPKPRAVPEVNCIRYNPETVPYSGGGYKLPST
jgi:hypothetical protein